MASGMAGPSGSVLEGLGPFLFSWLRFFSVLASFPGSCLPQGTSQKLQADILPQWWSESLSFPLVLTGLPK